MVSRSLLSFSSTSYRLYHSSHFNAGLHSYPGNNTKFRWIVSNTERYERKMKRPEARSHLELAVVALLAIARLSSAFSIPSFGSKALLDRRQSKNKSISSAISIAPSQYWDGIDGPWSSFPLQVGTGSVGGLQDVRVMISTAATAIWTIAAQGCPPNYPEDCANSRGFLFLTNQSLTWSPNSIYQTGLEANLGMDSSGFAGYDVATLGWQGSTTVKNDHSIIWNLADSNYWTGIFGLNPRPTNFSTFSNPQTGFMQSIFDQNVIPSLTYGYTAGNQYRLNEVFGSLTLGGYDANRFIPNNVSFDFYQDISRDLLVYLHSITTDKTSPSNLLPGGSISIFIDSTVAEIWLPESSCSAFEQAFGIEYDDNFGRYIITSDQRRRLLNEGAQVTFTIGPSERGGETVDITLPYQAFDLQVSFPIVMNPNTSYYFPLQRAANDTQYTLGRTFLQEAYLIADYEHQNFSVSACDWDEGKVQAQKIVSIISPNATRADSGDQSDFSTAEIAGIGVGIGGVIAILSFALFMLRRRRNQEKRRLAELAAKDAEEKLASSNSSRPVISYPIGGELGGGDIHEMPVGRKLSAAEMDSPYKADPNQHGYNEMAGGEYFASGKYYRYSVTEMDGTRPIYEMSGSDAYQMPTPERRPSVPPK